MRRPPVKVLAEAFRDWQWSSRLAIYDLKQLEGEFRRDRIRERLYLF